MRLPVFWDLMKDIPWLVLLQHHSQNKQFLWGYDIIFLNPSCVPKEPELRRQENSPASKQHESPQEWAYRVLSNFYNTTLSLNEKQKVIVSDALRVDQTIALIALRQRSKSALPNSFVRNKSTIVVAATTFRVSNNEQAPGKALVRWLGVRHMGPYPSHLLSSWRRKGIGSFMMKLVIKRCAWYCWKAASPTAGLNVETQAVPLDDTFALEFSCR